MSSNPIAACTKLAHKVAGFAARAQLLAHIPGWYPSRLDNCEADISTPAPTEVRLLATATGTSPCWLMFGDGPIRPKARDQQSDLYSGISAFGM